MPVAASIAAPQNQSSNVPGLILLAIGAAIAAIAPWGIAMGMATGHSPALRACLVFALGLIGLFFARRTGLEIMPTGLRHPVRVSFLIGAAVAVYVLFIDGFAFRSVLPTEYRAYFVEEGLTVRLIYFILRSFNECIIYQLFVGSTLVWIIGLVWRQADGRIAPGAYWLAMVFAHLLNIYINVVAITVGPVTPLILTYDMLRFVAPGILWGILYWRYGLATADLAHISTHVFLQPMLGIVFS
jgi:hypothetical protein